MPLPFPDDAVTHAPHEQLTREVFGNIPGWSQAAFYLLAAVAVAVFAYGVYRRFRLWQQGRAEVCNWTLRTTAMRLCRDVLMQHRVRGRGLASVAHLLLFSGFLVLFIGTTLIAIEHVLADLLHRAPTNPVFHKGLYFGVYELTMDTFGVALLGGCVMFLVRRLRSDASFARTRTDVALLVLLIAIGITGYLVEGLRIIHSQTPLPGLSPIGYACARMFSVFGITPSSASLVHFVLWWGHAVLALGFIALIPYTRLLHAIAGTVNLATRDHTLSRMKLVPLDEVEATGEIGVATLADFTRGQLLEMDACVSCGRCEDVCPAFEAGKPLSPRDVVQDLAAQMTGRNVAAILPGEVIGEETLWACTTCGACVDVCPLGVSPVRMITDLRRHLVGEGMLRGSPATALQKTDRAGNPWGLSPGDRLAWADGLNVPLASENSDAEVLYWVGCAAAYDRRLQNVARSMVRLLTAAKVNFAVLGPEERCTGEAARRMGDELLFQQLAERNVETLNQYRPRKIVAHCPHCVNSFRHDYPQVGGNYQVVHHSELLAELVAEGRLTPAANDANGAGAITYHDPCYLARACGVVDPPRVVLSAVTKTNGQLPIVELPRNGRNTSCCGGGGGRMWFDDAPAQRVGQGRVAEIVASGAVTVAVSCPFCLTMLGDGLAAKDSPQQVWDIAEILAENVLNAKS